MLTNPPRMSNPSLEQRVARLEAELTEIKSQQPPKEPEQPWWKKIVGMFADDPYFEAAVARGREYRESLGTVEAIADELLDLPEKSSHDYSLQEAIATLREPIAIALQRHYTFAEIATILTQQGIIVTANELSQYYLAAIPTRSESRTQSPRNKSRQIRSREAIQPA
jgi:hypothetical protein